MGRLKKCSIFLGAVLLAGLSACSNGMTESVNLAQVGEAVIDEIDVKHYMELLAYSQNTSMEAATDEISMDYVQNSVLENMITYEIMKQYLLQKEVKCPNESESQLLAQALEEAETDDSLQELMKTKDITEDELKHFYMEPVYSKRFYETIQNEYPITEEEMKRYYDENPDEFYREMVEARHILLTSEEESELVLEKLKQGETFEDLAREYSMDTATKDIGGELGSFGRNETIPEFENAVFNMEPGSISEPIRTTYGYHIIELEKRFREQVEFENAKSYIQDFLLRTKCNQTLADLRQEIGVDYFN